MFTLNLSFYSYLYLHYACKRPDSFYNGHYVARDNFGWSIIKDYIQNLHPYSFIFSFLQARRDAEEEARRASESSDEEESSSEEESDSDSDSGSDSDL